MHINKILPDNVDFENLKQIFERYHPDLKLNGIDISAIDQSQFDVGVTLGLSGEMKVNNYWVPIRLTDHGWIITDTRLTNLQAALDEMLNQDYINAIQTNI